MKKIKTKKNFLFNKNKNHTAKTSASNKDF